MVWQMEMENGKKLFDLIYKVLENKINDIHGMQVHG